MNQHTKQAIQSAIEHIKAASDELADLVKESSILDQSVRALLESDEEEFGSFLMTILALNTIADDLDTLPGMHSWRRDEEE